MKGEFQPRRSGVKALLDQLYDIKFSKHTTLVVVMLSMFYTVYRTQHYLSTTFKLHPVVAWPTSTFIELLVLASAALMFGALRSAYVAELKDQDVNRSKVGIAMAGIALAGAFFALLFVALGDAWALTKEVIPTIIMALTQMTQMLFIVGFINAADLDERNKLREEYKDYQTGEAERKARTCPFCNIEVAPNNRKRHMDACASRPLEV